jgi:hypothetical protein
MPKRGGGGVEAGADRRPVEHQRHGRAERATAALRQSESLHRMALAEHDGVGAAGARSARHRACGDREAGEIGALPGEGVGGVGQPCPGIGSTARVAAWSITPG